MSEEDAISRRPEWLFLGLSLGLFLLALAGVSFAREPVYYVGQSDAPAYLAVARSEPAHLAYDQKTYVLHPPAYPCAIRAASFLTRDLTAGAVLLGTLAAAGLVLVTFRLALALGFPVLDALLAAFLLATSHVLAYLAQGVYREPWQCLLLHGLVLALLSKARWTESAGRWRAGGTLVLAALAAWTWDPIVASAPLFVGAGWLARRPKRGLAVGATIAVAWLIWAEARRECLTAEPRFPAGIDGMVEETRPLPAAAFLNPNFLPETKRHNAHFWPRHPTVWHLLDLLGPEALAPTSIYIDLDPDGLPPWFRAGSQAVCLLALGGVVALGAGLREAAGRERARRFAALALPMGLLGAPGLLGNTGRYAANLVPAIALLAGHGALSLARALARRPATSPAGERRAVGAALVAWGGVVALGIARAPHLAVARPTLFEGRAVSQVLERDAPGSPVAAFVDWPSDLLWQLPGRRVLALPFRAERLEAFFTEHATEIVVVPLEVRAGGDSAADPAETSLALGLPALAAIASSSRGDRSSLKPLGVVFEAEVADAPRLHACQVLARPVPGRAELSAFGFYLPPGEGPAVASAILAGRATPLELAVLKANRAAISTAGESALAELLGRLP